jgi:hypothetical protein
MTPDHQSVALLLQRLEQHPPLEALITELDHSAAKALRGDIRRLGRLLQDRPDLMTLGETRQVLIRLREGYLTAPCELRDLMDQAIHELNRFATATHPGDWPSAAETSRRAEA